MITRAEVITVAVAWLLVLALIWATWQPAPQPAWAEEPCIRTTLSEYTRNYPLEGAILNRRPAEWHTCTPE
jgi:hypothetical protein